MGQILTAFGIDWRLLIIDSVNFGLLLLALWYFLYGPLMKILEERRRVVAKGVYDAEAAAERLKEIESSRSALLAEAGKEADEVLAKARAAAVTKQQEIIASGESASLRAIAEAEARARDMKESAIEESKKEVAKLVVLGMEKMMIQK